MNPDAFMLLDRLEKLMCSPQSQHPSKPFLGPVASMSRGWKGTLLKFGGEVGEGRVHLEDTFSVPLGSFQTLDGRPLQPCDLTHSLYVYLLCAPSLVPIGLSFLCGFFWVVPTERPAAGHHWMCVTPFVNQSGPGQCWTLGQSYSLLEKCAFFGDETISKPTWHQFVVTLTGDNVVAA